MKIKEDLLHITNAPETDDGNKAEPEQQTATRILVSESETTTSQGEPLPGGVPVQILVQSQAGVLANALRAQCGGCKHFDNAAFLTFARKADSPAAPLHLREGMNEVRGALLQTMNASVNAMHAGQDGDMDVEHALASLGFCHALTEINGGDDVIVHPLSCCPPEVKSDAQPLGLFSPRDRTSELAGQRAYDNIMNKAAGKIP